MKHYQGDITSIDMSGKAGVEHIVKKQNEARVKYCRLVLFEVPKTPEPSGALERMDAAVEPEEKTWIKPVAALKYGDVVRWTKGALEPKFVQGTVFAKQNDNGVWIIRDDNLKEHYLHVSHLELQVDKLPVLDGPSPYPENREVEKQEFRTSRGVVVTRECEYQGEGGILLQKVNQGWDVYLIKRGKEHFFEEKDLTVVASLHEDDSKPYPPVTIKAGEGYANTGATEIDWEFKPGMTVRINWLGNPYDGVEGKLLQEFTHFRGEPCRGYWAVYGVEEPVQEKNMVVVKDPFEEGLVDESIRENERRKTHLDAVQMAQDKPLTEREILQAINTLNETIKGMNEGSFEAAKVRDLIMKYTMKLSAL